jgi:hypothetical protein
MLLPIAVPSEEQAGLFKLKNLHVAYSPIAYPSWENFYYYSHCY